MVLHPSWGYLQCKPMLGKNRLISSPAQKDWWWWVRGWTSLDFSLWRSPAGQGPSQWQHNIWVYQPVHSVLHHHKSCRGNIISLCTCHWYTRWIQLYHDWFLATDDMEKANLNWTVKYCKVVLVKQRSLEAYFLFYFPSQTRCQQVKMLLIPQSRSMCFLVRQHNLYLQRRSSVLPSGLAWLHTISKLDKKPVSSVSL